MTDSGPMPDGVVTIITVTRHRPMLLARAIDSVARQCCRHVNTHIVIVDDCADTWASLEHDVPSNVQPRLVPREAQERSGPRRIAKLRDVGTEMARTR